MTGPFAPDRRLTHFELSLLADYGNVCACIVCGCTDDHACVASGTPCHWVRLDVMSRSGICSACATDDRVDKWDIYFRSEQVTGVRNG